MSIQDVARAVNSRDLFVALLSLGVATCGGCGGGPPPQPPSPPPPPPITLGLSANALSFSTVAPHTAAPDGVDLTATFTGSFTEPGVLMISVERENPGVATVGLSAGQSPGAGGGVGAGNLLLGTVRLGSPATLAKRAHTATITVCASMNVRSCQTNQIAGSPQVLTVTYNVGGIETSTGALAFDIGDAPTAADLTRTFEVTGHIVPSWAAAAATTTTPAWFTLAPATGDSTAPTTVTASLIQDTVDALANGLHTGTITITSEGAPRTIAVALTLQRTRVNYVAPYTARANVVDEVIVRGENFLQFAPTSVEFGPGNAAAAFTVDSDTQIRATHPALPAGGYDVRVINSAGAAPTRAQLVVVDTGPFTRESLEYPGGPGVTPTALIYDAERRALLVALLRGGMYSIARFAYTAGGWSAPTGVPVPSPNAAALSMDGRALFVGYDDVSIFRFALAELDPVTLVQTKLTHYPAEMEGDGIAVSSDGRAIVKTEMLCCSSNYPMVSYDPLKSALTLLSSPIVTLYSAGVGGSSDGSTILVATDDQSSPLSTPLLRYDSELGALVDSMGDIESLSTRIVLNRRGTHMLVRDLDGLKLRRTEPPNTVAGTLAAATLDAAFSPTADIVYGYDNTETLTAYDLATGIPLATGLTIAGTGNAAALVTVSPDGGTVFVAGNRQLAVIPAALVPR